MCFPNDRPTEWWEKKTTTSCYIIYYDYLHIVKYVIIVKREGKKMVSSKWVNKLIRNIRSKSAFEKWNVWIKQLDFNLWKIKFALNKIFFLLQWNNEVKMRWIPMKYRISYYIVAKALSLSSWKFSKAENSSIVCMIRRFLKLWKVYFFSIWSIYIKQLR